MSRDFSTRFTEEVYATKEEVKKAFSMSNIDSIWERSEIKPMVNQVEFHPGYLQMDTVNYSKEKGMLVQSFFPLANRF